MSDSPTRPWVNAFAEAMEAQLSNNREKGDRDGWKKCGQLWLLGCAMKETGEVADALEMLRLSPRGPHRQICKRRVVCECADASNFFMMIADVAGGMKPQP